jgi:monovalent cation:H+ antiporter-2, CPA2 family
LLRESRLKVKEKEKTMPNEFPLFTDLLVLLLSSVPIAFICQRLRLPVMVGFMVTGVLIGPSALGLIKNLRAIELLAEVGVALLLFTPVYRPGG